MNMVTTCGFCTLNNTTTLSTNDTSSVEPLQTQSLYISLTLQKTKIKNPLLFDFLWIFMVLLLIHVEVKHKMKLSNYNVWKFWLKLGLKLHEKAVFLGHIWICSYLFISTCRWIFQKVIALSHSLIFQEVIVLWHSNVMYCSAN